MNFSNLFCPKVIFAVFKLDTDRCSMMDLPFYWEAHCINNIGLYMVETYCNTFAIPLLTMRFDVVDS